MKILSIWSETWPQTFVQLFAIEGDHFDSQMNNFGSAVGKKQELSAGRCHQIMNNILISAPINKQSS